jgi:type VI secretion system secreted protein Hcp
MAVDYFLKMDPVKGESKDNKHKDTIDILSWTWGASNSGKAAHGGGAGAGKVNMQDVHITKHVDKASPDLMLACCNGQHFDNAMIICRKAGKEALEFLKIKMQEVFVTSVQVGGSHGDDRPTENVTLNFAKIQWEYTEQTETGGKGAAPKKGWSALTNEEWS